MRTQSITLVVLAALCSLRATAAEPKTFIGQKLANFTLKDHRGQPHSLDEAKSKIVVLAFLGTECPLCKVYAPRLAELAKEYEARGVAFLGVDSNRQDAVTEIASYARVHEIGFPILKDLNQVVADQVGATRTPEVVVLDTQRVIRYRGRIDDQYGFKSNSNYQKAAATDRNLAVALDELLSAKPVSKPQSQVAGCLIGRDLKPVANSEVTYSNQIARIMNSNCVFCHRSGQIAPFTLTSYEEVAGWAGMIDEVVQSQRMPPWHADAQFGHFKNDARLSAEDKATISKWVANGAPEGNPQDLPEPPKFAEGWMIPQPDEILYMQDKPFEVPATGVVDYQMFVVDPGWKEDKWITAIEPRPGNPSVVHHILLFVIPPDGNINAGLGSGNDFLGAFAPGLRPEPLPAGLARSVKAGSKLIFQLHYTPNGSAQKDRSYCGFVFADPKTVKKEVRVSSAVNFVFQIPPGESDFGVNSRYIFKQDTLLLTLMPHMHLRGKAFRYEAIYPDGNKEVLLDVPRYDFGWQTNYRLAEPKLMPRGTRLDCFAHFDNSEDNLNNPDPKVPVRFGDQTFEEMMIGFFEAAPVDEDLQNPTRSAKRLSRMDEFAVILAATKGEPDDNIKVGAYMAMSEPRMFGMFGQVLRTMVPQIDRLCITAVQDGKVSELMGPMSSRGHRERARDAAAKDASETARNEAVEKLIKIPDNILSPLPSVDAQGESLAEYAAGTKVVVNNDLSKAKGTLFETMVKRGAKSSLHVPVDLKGIRATINFWSAEPDAFSPPAEALLTGIAKIMAAPKDNAQAAAR
ncbi:MAG: redoxin domain-containing protein [Planctomycetia bacterium]|nr:redoxin domain-containing protein [Planctomycetia bacterium]